MPDTSDTGKDERSRTELLRVYVRDARRFFTEELWDRDLSALPRMKRFVFSSCRVASIVVKGFIADNCGLQASALTYISLMSMIPVLAMMFSFSKGIGMQNHLIEAIGLEKVEVTVEEDGDQRKEVEFRIVERDTVERERSPGTRSSTPTGPRGFSVAKLPPPMQKVVTTILSYVENTRFGTLGLAGMLLLFWAAVKAMSKLEKSFNAIWGIRASRPLFRKLTEYFFVLVLVPILFFTASSLNAALSSPAVIDRLAAWVGPLVGLYRGAFRLFGVAVVVSAFTFLYKFMPNTRVKLFPASIAGLVGGVLWYVTQFIYITFQIGITKYNAIYGTFAAVPFFLAWLYMNWMIVLFGAEVSFAVQNHRTYLLEGLAESASPAARVLLGLVLTYEACRAHLTGDAPWCPSEWAREYAIPARMVAGVTDTLERNGILISVGGDEDRVTRVVPGRAVDHITLANVEEAFRHSSEPYAKRLLQMIPAKAADAFAEKYERFIDDLSGVTFRELLES